LRASRRKIGVSSDMQIGGLTAELPVGRLRERWSAGSLR
jgi:hypothetical protein